MIGRIPTRMNRTSPYRSLPKVELHCHLEGSVRPETVVELANRDGLPVGSSHPGEIYNEPGRDPFVLLATVCSVLRTADDFRRVAYESTVDAAAAGVRYRELSVAPALHLDRGVDFEALWQGLDRGLADAEHDSGVVTRVIIEVDKGRGLADGRALLALARCRPRDRLVGLGAEACGPVSDHRPLLPLIAEAADCGLRSCFHCGTDGPADEIAEVVAAGIDRVDHGTRLLDRPALAAIMVERGIPVTSCPSANVERGVVPGLADHPFARQRQVGVLATLSSDVPAFLSFDLGDEYLRVADTFGLSLAAMMEISLDGIEASWMDRCDKTALAGAFRAEALAAGLDEAGPSLESGRAGSSRAPEVG